MHFTIKRKHFVRVESTQKEAKKNARHLLPNLMTAYIADAQTQGKGTLGRKWVSPPDLNLYVTFSFKMAVLSIPFTHLPLVVGYTVIKTLQQFDIHSQLKWVNDVQIHHKKIAGILCETESLGNMINFYIGIGININMDRTICEKLDQPATSMKVVLQEKIIDKEKVYLVLEKYFAKNMEIFFTHGFKYFHQQISNLIAYKNQEIIFDTKSNNNPNDFTQGYLLGIDEAGQLRLKVNDTEKLFFSGRIVRAKP